MLNRFVFYLVLIILGCLSTPVVALAVSEIELNSNLNQALNARIVLSDIKSGDLDSLNVRILEVNNGAGVLPGAFDIEVVGEDNKHFIHITSSKSIREPILSFTLELIWGQGRLIREYNLLIDPIQ